MKTTLGYPGSLHNHTDFSNLRLRDCIIKTEELIDYAIELGHEVVAITDHDSVSNAIKVEKYYNKVKEKNPNFKVILGNEIYLTRNGLNGQNFKPKKDKYYHFVLLAKDAIGHKQIREISTRAWERSYMARGMRRVPTYYQDLIDIIGANPGHVVASTACLGGLVPTQLLNWRETNDETIVPRIEIWIEQMKEIFGEGNFFLELQPSNNVDQVFVNKALIALSKRTETPYIITTDSHYLKKSDRKVHKAYLQAQSGEREVDAFYATTYLMETEELESFFEYFDEEQLDEAYRNILAIKNMCSDYTLLKDLEIPELFWKTPKSLEPDSQRMKDQLIEEMPEVKKMYKSSYEGNRRLVDLVLERVVQDKTLQDKRTLEEINDNFRIIRISSEVNKVNWSAYFLNLQNIVDICWEANSLVGPGRGSGVGFLLLYILGITQINPLRENTETFSWRFLDPERVSVLDVDLDSESSRREDILNAFRDYYGADRVANVITFGTEKAKSAIQTAARGLGIDVDTAQYLSSLVPADRGMIRTLSQCMYGDKENGWAPVSLFVHEMTNNFPELWEVASKIEGLVCRMGTHAGGVIFVDKPFTESTSLMRAPDGTLITAFDLHDCEDAGLIKYDILAVNALDKMHNTIDLLCDYGYAERKPTLKETYEDIIGIYNLERDDEKMWKMVWNHEVTSLFQMEQQSGVQGIALTKPRSVDELAVLNSVIRLMAQEKGAEQPLNKFARFKNNINLWYQEMREHGLTQKEMELLEPILKISFGICESQEKFMQLVQLPELGGFSVRWADKLRKAVAKKEPAAFEALTEEFFERVKEKGLSINLAKYVWNVLIATSRGYGFNASHTLAYSLIALQQMNLAFKYPTIFWNTACLISDSGGDESDEDKEEEEEWIEEEYDDNIEDFAPEEDDEDEDEDEDGAGAKKEKKKKKRRATDYGKIAAAIGRMKNKGIQVAPPDINKSTYTFSPDVENSVIRYGMSGLARVGEGLIQTIIEGRPYESVEDFEKKVKTNVLQMLSLLKAGAFDSFGERTELVENYIRKISKPKKRVTLQNLRMLIEFGLIPEEYDMQSKVFNFNRYLKKHKLGTYYEVDKIAFDFYEKHFDMDHLEPEGENFKIKQSTWDSIYQSHMDIIRPFVRENSKELLEAMNNRLMKDTWEKYCLGGVSKWEMDSASCYFHDHELEHVDAAQYKCVDYASLPEVPEIERIIYIRGKRVALQKITRIMGTVLDRDKSKRLVTLLTTSGVVTVRIYGDAFTHYDRQISEKLPTGKKRIVERSWFTRGNKVIITGVRQGDNFIAKKYKSTPYPLVELITEVGEDNKLVIQSARAEVV